MFEQFVCNRLNEVLRKYIEEIDSSKLKHSFWQGKAELNDLHIKQSALEELRLPIRLVYGRLDNLKLVIPWFNWFAGVFEAHVSGLVLLVAPNTYKELLPQTEMAILDVVRQVRARAASQNSSAFTRADATDVSDYVKLITQTDKNIKVTIKGVHIRYTDSVRTLKHPFSIEVTLESLPVFSMSNHCFGSPSKFYTSSLDIDRSKAELNNLDIKQSALEELRLPIRPLYGHLGVCPVPPATCPVPPATCPVPHATCPVPHATCPVPPA
ncbi:Vacuolar protein sorting-associated protein 13 N-terminal domain, partial [Trinorchestia longiramus]